MPTPAELLTSGEPILQDDELYKSGMLTAKAWAGFLALFATGTGGGGGGGGGGDASAANQNTQITALADLLTELELKADLTETQPVSVAGVATAALQTALENLLTDTADPSLADADANTFINLSRRKMIREEHVKEFVTEVVDDTDREVIPAPGVGNRIVLIKVRAQNTTGNETRLQFTHFDTTTDVNIDILNTEPKRSGVGEVYPYEDWIRLPENTSLRVVPSVDEAHDVTAIYYRESVTTGLPI